MKTFIKNLVIGLSLMGLFTACSGQPLIQNASGSVTGFVAELLLVHHPSPDADGDYPDFTTDEGREFDNDLGYTVALHNATVSWHKVTLISEGDDPDCIAGNDAELHVNVTEDLIGEDLLSSNLGENDIEDRAYCQYEVTLGPVDHEHATIVLAAHGDAAEETEESEHSEHEHAESETGEDNLTDAHQDAAVHLMGHWSKDGDMGQFMIEITDEIIITHNFKAKVDGVTEDHALHFHEGETSLQIVFGTNYHKLFEGIDFENDSDADISEKIIENLQNGVIHQHLGAHHSS